MLNKLKTRLTKKGYAITKKFISEDFLNKLKKDLIVKPIEVQGYSNENDLKPFPVYTEDSKYIYIPRYYGIDNYGLPKKSDLTENKSEFNFKSNLREYQNVIVNDCLDKIKKIGGGLLSVPCGYGKTIMALYIASQLKMKTLVLVHKTFLQDQWVERIEQFTDAKIGIIRQDKIEIENKNIVIGMVQSITKRDYGENAFDSFDFLIVDEAHRYGSRVFSTALQKIGAKYTLSLSATPKRNDGLTKVIEWYTGPVLHRIEKKQNQDVVVKVFKFRSLNQKYFKDITRKYQGKLVPFTVKMINNLIKIKHRDTQIVNIIMNLMKLEPDRVILILSGRREHLGTLKDLVDTEVTKLVSEGTISEQEINTRFYVGGMKQHQLDEASKNGNIIFGTYEMAQEGLDIDKLNTLILATPKSNITQAIGRIMRKVLTTGDLKPLIIDICDELSSFMGQSRKRISEYRSNKYKIYTHYLLDHKLLTYEEYIKLENPEKSEQELEKLINKRYSYESDFNKILNIERIEELEQDSQENQEDKLNNLDKEIEEFKFEDKKTMKKKMKEYLF
jgi:superfamily II DNA or RNA helicase